MDPNQRAHRRGRAQFDFDDAVRIYLETTDHSHVGDADRSAHVDTARVKDSLQGVPDLIEPGPHAGTLRAAFQFE